jgi:predicted transcriptional regulator
MSIPKERRICWTVPQHTRCIDAGRIITAQERKDRKKHGKRIKTVISDLSRKEKKAKRRETRKIHKIYRPEIYKKKDEEQQKKLETLADDEIDVLLSDFSKEFDSLSDEQLKMLDPFNNNK